MTMVSNRRLSTEEGVAIELALQEDILDSTALAVHDPIERGLSLEEMVEQGMFRNGDLASLLSVSRALVGRLEALQRTQAEEMQAVPAPHFRTETSARIDSLGPVLDAPAESHPSEGHDSVQRLNLATDSVLPVMDDEDDNEEFDVVQGLEPSDDWTPGWEKWADVTVVPCLKFIRKMRLFLYLAGFIGGVAGVLYLILNTQLPGQ